MVNFIQRGHCVRIVNNRINVLMMTLSMTFDLTEVILILFVLVIWGEAKGGLPVGLALNGKQVITCMPATGIPVWKEKQGYNLRFIMDI